MNLEFVPCEVCQSKPRPEWLSGFYYKDDTKQTIMECRCHRVWKERMRVITTIERQGITLTEEDLTYQPTELSKNGGDFAVKAFDLILQDYKANKGLGNFKGKLVYLQGEMATGKTTLVRWLLRELVKSKAKVSYYSLSNMVAKLFPIGFDDGVQADAKLVVGSLIGQEIIIVDGYSDEDSVLIKPSQINQIEPLFKKLLHDDKKLLILLSRSAPTDSKKNIPESLRKFVEIEVTKSKSLLKLSHQFVFNTEDIFQKVRE